MSAAPTCHGLLSGPASTAHYAGPMLELRQGWLLEAWRTTLQGLGVEADARTLIGGPGVENLAIELGAPVADATGTLVSLGAEAGPLTESAVPSATALPTDSFDAVLMLSAWERPAEVGPVVREAARLVVPGGSVWIGERNGPALVHSTPATHPSALMYIAYPEVGEAIEAASQPPSLLGMEMVRAGMRPVTSDDIELPIAVLADLPEYIEAVRLGMWPGVELLSDDQLDAVLATLERDPVAPVSFPFIEHRPWVMVRGVQPG